MRLRLTLGLRLTFGLRPPYEAKVAKPPHVGHFQRTYVPIRHFRGSVSIVLSTIETKSARCVSCDHTDHTKSELTHIGNISYEISDDISPSHSQNAG